MPPFIAKSVRHRRHKSALTLHHENLHRFRKEWEKQGLTRGALRRARRALRATGAGQALFPAVPVQYMDESELPEEGEA